MSVYESCYYLQHESQCVLWQKNCIISEVTVSCSNSVKARDTLGQPGRELKHWRDLLKEYRTMKKVPYLERNKYLSPDSKSLYISFQTIKWITVFKLLECYFGSCDSAVSKATGYGLDDGGFGVWVLVGSRIFSSPHRPDQFWGPTSLLSTGYRWHFPWG
jgi:hypothetical protein